MQLQEIVSNVKMQHVDVTVNIVVQIIGEMQLSEKIAKVDLFMEKYFITQLFCRV